MMLETIRFLGFHTKPSRISLNGKSVNFTFNQDNNLLLLETLTQTLLSDFTVTWDI